MLTKSNKNNSLWIPTLLISYNFVANLANDIYLPCLPKLVTEFLTTENIVQLTMFSWFAGIALPQIFLGPLSEAKGRKPIMMYGSFFFLLSTLLCSVAPNIISLIIGRFFQGIGVCCLNVTIYCILSDLYEHRMRIKILSYFGACGFLAPLFGPIIGGYIYVWFGWRAVFIFIFILIGLFIIGTWIKVPESNLSLNPYAIQPWTAYKNYIRIFSNRYFLRHLIPYCLMLSASIAYMTAAPFIIIKELQLIPELFGYTQIPIFAFFFIGSILVNSILQIMNLRSLILTGILIAISASFIMFMLSVLLDMNLIIVIAPMVLYSFGFSLCSGSLISEIMSSTTCKGYLAASLGTSTAVSFVLTISILSLTFNGTMVTVSALILGLMLIALTAYHYIH